MSSAYSSPRSSRGHATIHLTSRSVPETPSIRQERPVFRTVPVTPELNRLLPDENGLDLEILTHKLQLYQLEMEEAELRLKQRKSLLDKQAADVAAAARFRSEVDTFSNIALDRVSTRSPTEPERSRSTSLNGSLTTRSSVTSRSTSVSKRMDRQNRPQPIQISQASLQFQQGSSIPVPAQRPLPGSMDLKEAKRHRRTTTISAGRNVHSTVIMVSSPGRLTEYDYSIPPVPQLSSSASATASPTTLSPLTPLPLTPTPTEDQLRRELETFALEQGPNIHMSRRSSVASRRKMPAAFVPKAEDIVIPKLPQSESLTALVDATDPLVEHSQDGQTLNRKKSFFGRFEKRNEVDDLLDLYMTDQQLTEEKEQKRKSTKLRRHLTKIWNSSEMIPQKASRPG